MEQLVQALIDRTPDDKKMSVHIIMDNAINEMHNNGIISRLSPEDAARMHDPDPNVRVTEKTLLAKSVGKNFIPITQPLPLENGIGYLASVEYEPRFMNSISLCIQGGIEGLYQSGIWQKNKNKIMEYHVLVSDNGHDIAPFVANMTVFNDLYPDFEIKVVNQKDTKKNSAADSKPAQNTAKKPAEKKGFFSKLFGK